MIYTIGYQKLTSGKQLAEILKAYGITHLVDVRSKPYSRKTAFNKNRLGPELGRHGIAYMWAGTSLGGFSRIDDTAIMRLAFFQHGKNVCLMCMEADPDRCHRKTELAVRLAKNHKVASRHILT